MSLLLLHYEYRQEFLFCFKSVYYFVLMRIFDVAELPKEEKNDWRHLPHPHDAR